MLIFTGVCLGGLYVHEIGHAVFGWVQGIPILPTPAKEYILQPQVDWHQKAWISFGGVMATAMLVIGVLPWYVRAHRPTADAVLAGVLLPTGVYTLRFLLAGRGHDGLEWQEAQSAVGANPSGHAIDLLFLALFLAGCAALAIRGRTSFRWRSLLRVVALALLGLAVVVVVQVGNNAIFDRFFREATTLNVPAGIETK